MRKALIHLRRRDPVLAALMRRVGPFRMEYREPSFEALVRSIVYQQLSGKVALIIFNRFRAGCLLPDAPLTPASILARTEAELRATGISTQKAKYIRSLAEHTADGRVRFEHLPACSDEDVVAHLTQVKGIGVWTAQMFLMFALRRPDILPTGDLGVRVGMQRLYGLETVPSVEEMQRYAESWQPYRSIATWYLWQSFELK